MRILYNIIIIIIIILSPILIFYRILKKKEDPKRFLEKFSFNKKKVFEPKFTTKTKGMGLGLGIVKNIIDSHNGTIKYETGKKGTTFIVTLEI